MVFSSKHGRVPTGKIMPDGFIEIPGVAVAINMKSGQADWWGTGLRHYETNKGTGYEPDKFMKSWEEIAVPILNLRRAGLVASEAPRAAIENAIRFVARCRHYAMGDLTLNSVIATETILNPFNERGTPVEKLAIFAAGLIGGTEEERKTTYRAAKELYDLRNLAVHQSDMHGPKAAKESGQRAFRLFLGCLKAIIEWAKTTIANGKSCSRDEFREFYLRTIL